MLIYCKTHQKQQNQKIHVVLGGNGSYICKNSNYWLVNTQVARTYYRTAKGRQAADIGRQFLEEWRKIKEQERLAAIAEEDPGDMASSLREPLSTLEMVDIIKVEFVFDNIYFILFWILLC